MAATVRPLLAIAISVALIAAAAWWGVSKPPHHASPRSSVSHSPIGTPSRDQVPPPANPDTFALVVHTSAGDLPARVAPISVASHQVVDPPHTTPQQWNTAAWVVQAAYPAAPSSGTTYVYGHACNHHVCPFTNLKDADVGDAVVATTPTSVLSYRIDRIGLSPRSASSLPPWASDSTVKNRIVLVTCEYEHGDMSVNNIVVVADLVSASHRAPS